MNILNVSSGRSILKSYNSSSLKNIKINGTANKKDIGIPVKEIHIFNKGKQLARENLDATYNSSINHKFQESLEHKLSQLTEIKSMIENKDKENDVTENTKVELSIKSTDKIKSKKDISISEEENLFSEQQINLEDINKKISETKSELKDSKVLAKELSEQSEIIDDKISMYKKMYGNDMFKMAEKEVILKKVYDNRNNPLINELKSTFNEIIELESKLKDKLNKDQK
ncbi:MAG: hypothetical protein ACRDC3_12885 [Paraclostridium dentum]|uniref:Uncharacterized protein n=1 Tax=Paraclostridium bifermentans TaxID=1490 RepID=A0AA44DN44_PARBF|nr:hypothetical protein [Paraclostridium bifermentans]MBN8049215.1 hypothetical protein [Paraclostridium bifermentans]NME10803.1 hypothetical protein [Paraclostridium bifermentans]